MLVEGWYLMSDRDVEIELARLKGEPRNASSALSLSVEEALAYRSAGNVPDGEGRSLRLVLSDEETSFEKRRLVFEPDLHAAPTWRREGSRPVTLIPLPRARASKPHDWQWSDEPAMKRLEDEWTRTGSAAGVKVPADLRGFLFKTIAALQASNQEITIESVCSSIARWLRPSDVARIRDALLEAESASSE